MGGAFSHDFVETVRSAADIVRVIGDYVPLKPAGVRLKGLCPFHQEKTPSFSVDPRAQLFYCFGCQTGGDVFKFVTLYEKLGFVEAVELLARRFGVPLPTSSPQAMGPAERVLEINRVTAAFYARLLDDREAGAGCRDYLARRGIGDETRRKLALGFAPDAWEALGRYLAAKGFKAQDVRTAGLALPRKTGDGQYDRFRNRLIFPIRDVTGRIVAFGGRALGDAEAKYINSPETPAYTKGDHLYGLDMAREAIRREGFAIVVEGYLDLAAVMQAGFENVVASLGTAFTPAQARLLARTTERVAVSYDGDAAGASAAKRSLDLLLERGFDVRVVELPGGSDPDDFIGCEGPAAYGQLVRDAPAYLQFLVRAEARGRDLGRVEDKIAVINAVLPHVAKLEHAIERASWATRLADELQLEDGLVLQELRAALKAARPEIRQRPERRGSLRDVDVRLVLQLLRSDDERRRWADELDPADLHGCAVAPIVDAILRMTRRGESVDPPSVLAVLEDDSAASELFTRIAFRDEPEDGPTVEDCLWVYRRAELQRREKQVARELGRLQDPGAPAIDPTDVNQRLLQLQQLARQRDAL